MGRKAGLYALKLGIVSLRLFCNPSFYCPTQAVQECQLSETLCFLSNLNWLINFFVHDMKLCCFLWDKIILSIRLFHSCIWMFIFLRGHIIFQELFSFKKKVTEQMRKLSFTTHSAIIKWHFLFFLCAMTPKFLNFEGATDS